MNRNAMQILEDLDKHASEFNFPVLDNDYVEFAAARLSAFRGVNDWLIVFEVLGFSTREIEFTNHLYAFGSCVGREGLVGEEIPITSAPKQPLFDVNTNELTVDWARWEIKVGDQTISFSPTRDEYAEAGIMINSQPGRGSLSEIELLRFLVHRLGEARLFLNDEALLGKFPDCKGLKKVLQTTQWQHPDVASEEKPSHNVSIRSLVEALSERNPSLFKQGRPNTHWSFWDRRDDRLT
jgi:hypothetical protein